MRARWYDPGTGRWLSKDFIWDGTNRYAFVGNQFSTSVDYSGLERKEIEFPLYRDPGSGKTFDFWVDSQGTRDMDYIESQREAHKQSNGKYSGNRKLKNKGTWHHAEFNPETGKMRMQLVCSKAHRSSHKGAMSEFFDWAADNAELLGTDNFNKLSSSQQAALTNALFSGDRQMKNRLAKRGLEIIRDGSEIIVRQKGSIIGKIARSKVAGRWIARLASGAGVYFFISAMQEASANGSSNGDAVAAGIRDMIDAETWEAGFQMTIVSGCDTAWEGFVPSVVSSRPTAKKLWPFYTKGERKAIIDHYSEATFTGLVESTKASKVSFADAFDDIWDRLPK